MRTRSLRLFLALAGASLSVIGAAQSPSSFYFPDDTHIVLFTSGGTFTLDNEQGVSWQVDAAQQKAFEAWRTKLVGKPETSLLVKDLLGKNKKKAMKKVGDLHAVPPNAGTIPLVFTFPGGKPSVTLPLKTEDSGKTWNPAPGSSDALSGVADGLGLTSRSQLEPSLLAAGDGGKPWTHIVRMLESSPKSYLQIGRSGVLALTRDEAAPSDPPSSATNPKTSAKPVTPPASGGGQTAILIGGIAFVVIAAGGAYFVLRSRSQGMSSAPEGDKQKVVRINAEEFKLLQFFQGEANRRLSSAPDAADREESLQLILTRFRGYPDMEGHVRTLKQKVEHLEEQVRLLSYFKNYSEQAESFLKKHEKLQSDFEALKARANAAEASVKALEQDKTTLTREKADSERSLKAARADLTSAEELFAQQVDALDALAADLARLKERIE